MMRMQGKGYAWGNAPSTWTATCCAGTCSTKEATASIQAAAKFCQAQTDEQRAMSLRNAAVLRDQNLLFSHHTNMAISNRKQK